MAPWVVAGAMALQKFQEGRQKSAARKSAISDMHSQRAASYGYPTEGFGAQRQAQDINDIEGPNYLGMMMDAEDKKKASGGGKLGGRDYLRAFMG
jgi:hypothetical protein